MGTNLLRWLGNEEGEWEAKETYGDRKAPQRRGRIKVKVERARHPGNVGEILRRGARAIPGSQELGGGR